MAKAVGLPRRPLFDDVDTFDTDDRRDPLLSFVPPRGHDDRSDRDHDDNEHHEDEHIVPLPYDAGAFPDGVASGDVTQTSAVLWTRAGHNGLVTFQVSTDP